MKGREFEIRYFISAWTPSLFLFIQFFTWRYLEGYYILPIQFLNQPFQIDVMLVMAHLISLYLLYNTFAIKKGLLKRLKVMEYVGYGIQKKTDVKSIWKTSYNNFSGEGTALFILILITSFLFIIKNPFILLGIYLLLIFKSYRINQRDNGWLYPNALLKLMGVHVIPLRDYRTLIYIGEPIGLTFRINNLFKMDSRPELPLYITTSIRKEI